MLFHRGHKPEWIYEALPYLYAAAGLATILALGNPIAMFSGGMLISAGASVLVMRRANRKRVRDVPRLAAGPGTPGAPAADAGFLELLWRKEYEGGEPTIDTQHRSLFATGNALLDAILTNRPKPEVEHFLALLVDDVTLHFRTEEEILDKLRGGIGENHKAIHRKLIERAHVLRADYARGSAGLGELISFVAYDVIAQHIATEDRGWFARLKH
jgi:hemerythrin-like metal-binding protein